MSRPSSCADASVSISGRFAHEEEKKVFEGGGWKWQRFVARPARMRMEAVRILEVVTGVCETLGSSRMGAGFLSVLRRAWYGLDGLNGMGMLLRRSLRGRVASGSARSCLLPVRNYDILSHLFLLGHPGLLRPARTAGVLPIKPSSFDVRRWKFNVRCSRPSLALRHRSRTVLVRTSSLLPTEH